MPQKPDLNSAWLAADAGQRWPANSMLESVLDLLACPACLEPLLIAPSTVTCTKCGRIYPVLDGIAILLIDRATLPA